MHFRENRVAYSGDFAKFYYRTRPLVGTVCTVQRYVTFIGWLVWEKKSDIPILILHLKTILNNISSLLFLHYTVPETFLSESNKNRMIFKFEDIIE